MRGAKRSQRDEQHEREKKYEQNSNKCTNFYIEIKLNTNVRDEISGGLTFNLHST